MKVGMLVAMQNHPDNYHADHHLYWEECQMADLAEPLGFDSLWAIVFGLPSADAIRGSFSPCGRRSG